jgi:hypothetical protein
VAPQAAEAQVSEDAGLQGRVDRVEERLDGQDSKLDQILSQLGQALTGGRKAEPEPKAEAGRPADIAEQVRQELERAKAEDASERAAAQEKSEAQELKDRVAKLTEKTPESPQPRRERVMWGKR